MDYKSIFSKEELNELTDWFNERKDKLPETLQVDDATFVKDLHQTVDYYLRLVELYHDKRAFSGQLYLLERIRKKLIELGL
ncbi:MAG: DUF6965 family protein [Alloprevotella sp.]